MFSFLEHNIITRFGIPNSLVFDNAKYLSSLKLTKYAIEKGITIKYYLNYYPKGNGLVESSNKNLICMFKKTIQENQRNQHNKLRYALWTNRVTPKK